MTKRQVDSATVRHAVYFGGFPVYNAECEFTVHPEGDIDFKVLETHSEGPCDIEKEDAAKHIEAMLERDSFRQVIYEMASEKAAEEAVGRRDAAMEDRLMRRMGK